MHFDAIHSTRRSAICNLLPLALVFSTVVGCGGGGQQDPVRPDTARQTLTTALDSWKGGKTQAELQAATPAIVVQDPDWAAKAALTDYSVKGDGEAVGSNLSVQVDLKLKSADGKEESKLVWYLVGTDPALTVFRDLLKQ